MSYKQTFKKSLLAGILIGLGVIINLQPSLVYHTGPVLFSFGLITIFNMQLLLYTGKIGYLKGKLPLILLFNFIGVLLTIELYLLGNNSFYYIIEENAKIKFSKSILTLFINGFFCGTLIHFAAKNKERTIITVFAIMIFILIGAEHCIADFPFLIFNLSFINIIKFIFIIIGNSLGAILIERLSLNEQICRFNDK